MSHSKCMQRVECILQKPSSPHHYSGYFWVPPLIGFLNRQLYNIYPQYSWNGFLVTYLSYSPSHQNTIFSCTYNYIYCVFFFIIFCIFYFIVIPLLLLILLFRYTHTQTFSENFKCMVFFLQFHFDYRLSNYVLHTFITPNQFFDIRPTIKVGV